MIHFEEILEKVEAYNPNCDQDLLRRAYVFSAREHRGQVRRSGEPYLVHPLNVASILADLKADDVSIVVGLAWLKTGKAHAFRWEQSTGMVDLGAMNGRSSQRRAPSHQRAYNHKP